MQIDIDFEVFKALTALRLNETDSYNAVIRRVLGFPNGNSLSAFAAGPTGKGSAGGLNSLAKYATQAEPDGPFGHSSQLNALGQYLGGVWFGNVHFPEGTRFRAGYKGQTYHAEIKNGQWIGADGNARNSPSDAASAISNTNVNGWRFWHVQMPGDPTWRKLDELKS